MPRQNALLIHRINCHYEVVYSIINYFGDNFNLDIVFNNNNQNIKSWLKTYSKVNKKFNLLDCNFTLHSLLPIKRYDLIILDTEDVKANWNFWESSYKLISNKSTRFFVVSHDNAYPIANYFVPDNKLTRLTIQGIHSGPDYYSPIYPMISPEKKMKIIKRDSLIRVVIVGDICNRDPNFIYHLKNRISNYKECEFAFINRDFSANFRSSLGGGLIYKLYKFIDADLMFNILFLSDYIYYYPEDLKGNIAINCTGSHNLSYSSLCKFICPIEFIQHYHMNPSFDCYLRSPSDTIILHKITDNDISTIYDDGCAFVEHTRAYINTHL